MNTRKHLLQIVLFIVAAAAIAVIANGFAGRERRLVLPGYYPNARVVPPRVPENVPPPRPAVTATAVTATQPVLSVTNQPVPPTTNTVAPPSPAPAPVPAPRTPIATTTTQPPVKPPTTPAPAPAADVLARFTPHPDKPYVEIGGDDAQALHAKGVLFLDARRTSVYEEGHIAGARSYSVWESDVDEKVNTLYNERSDPRDQNLPIVIYCSGGACEDSHMLAQKLWGIQFNNVYVYKDGFPDWQKRGAAVKTGSNP